MKYLILAIILLSSCSKNKPTLTCEEYYTYSGKPALDFHRTKQYDLKWQNSDYLTTYNPMTGVLTWVKRAGTHTGTNKAMMYNTQVNFKIFCR